MLQLATAVVAKVFQVPKKLIPNKHNTVLYYLQSFDWQKHISQQKCLAIIMLV